MPRSRSCSAGCDGSGEREPREEPRAPEGMDRAEAADDRAVAGLMPVNGHQHARIYAVARLDAREIAVQRGIARLAAADQVRSDVPSLVGRKWRDVAAVRRTARLRAVELDGPAVQPELRHMRLDGRFADALTPGERCETQLISLEPGGSGINGPVHKALGRPDNDGRRRLDLRQRRERIDLCDGRPKGKGPHGRHYRGTQQPQCDTPSSTRGYRRNADEDHPGSPRALHVSSQDAIAGEPEQRMGGRVV